MLFTLLALYLGGCLVGIFQQIFCNMLTSTIDKPVPWWIRVAFVVFWFVLLPLDFIVLLANICLMTLVSVKWICNKLNLKLAIPQETLDYLK